MTIKKRIRCKPGDIFVVPLSDHAFALAVITYASKIFIGVIGIGVYPELYRAPALPDVLPSKFVLFPLYCAKQSVNDGTWPRVGSLGASPVELPEMIVGGEVWVGDVFIREASDQELRRIHKLSVSGDAGLEMSLRKHFGLPYSFLPPPA